MCKHIKFTHLMPEVTDTAESKKFDPSGPTFVLLTREP